MASAEKDVTNEIPRSIDVTGRDAPSADYPRAMILGESTLRTIWRKATISQRVAAAILAIVVGVAGVHYGSPYWVVHQMQAAARAGEGDRLAGYVDFPAVRESIKSQLQAITMKKMQNDDHMKGNPFAAIGMMLAAGMVNMMVDGMVTQESLVSMVNSGKPKPTTATPPPVEKPNDDPSKRPRIDRHYEGMSVFKVEMHDSQTDVPLLTLVLNREGWFGWKLKAVRLPALAEN